LNTAPAARDPTSRSIAKNCFVIPPAVENTFNQNGVSGHHKRNIDAAFEPRHAQPGQNIVPPPAAWGKVESPLQNATMRLM
jgi:hypothetical protein